MDDDPASDARHAALAARSRRLLLDVLRARSGPLDAGQLAAASDLHVTTVRFHLGQLEAAGLVRRGTEHAGRRGRPRQVYAAVADTGPGTRSDTGPADGHRELAGVLAGVLAAGGPDGRSRAESGGRAWAAAQVAARPAAPSWDGATREIEALFARLGFAPRVSLAGTVRRVELHGCPFRDTARAYPDVVCAVHLGLLNGAVGRMGLPEERVGLRPFVGPDLCVVDIEAGGQGAAGTGGQAGGPA